MGLPVYLLSRQMLVLTWIFVFESVKLLLADTFVQVLAPTADSATLAKIVASLSTDTMPARGQVRRNVTKDRERAIETMQATQNMMEYDKLHADSKHFCLLVSFSLTQTKIITITISKHPGLDLKSTSNNGMNSKHLCR